MESITSQIHHLPRDVNRHVSHFLLRTTPVCSQFTLPYHTASSHNMPTAILNNMTEAPPLNHRNWLNFFAYIANVVITYGVGTMAWVGNGTRSIR